MACDGAAVFKGVQFVLCVVCLVYKRVTDNEALRVFYHLEKLSREWPLLNNVTWDENGALLADITFGGFALVALGLLVGAVAGELKRARRLVCFFQVLGCIMFLIVGGLCLAAIDSVPHHLVDNAIVLGVLSILTGLLFLIDLALTGNKKSSSTAGQEKKPIKVVVPPSKVVEATKKADDKKDSKKEAEDTKMKKNFGNGVLKELRSSLKKKKTVEDLDGRGVVVEKNDKNVEFEKVKEVGKETEKVDHTIDKTGFDRDELDRAGFERNGLERSGYDRSGDEYRQYGRRRMDNRGFPRADSVDSGRFSSEQRFRSEFLDAERDRWLDRDPGRTAERHERQLSLLDRETSEKHERQVLDRESAQRQERNLLIDRDLPAQRQERQLVDREPAQRRERHASLLEGTYDPRRSRPSSMMEVELDEHYLRPQDYFIEKRVSKEERRLQDQRVTSSRHDYSDEDYQSQLPSVSFLVSERGRKVLPSVKTSPVERLQEVTTGSNRGKPRYYFNSSRDPASGSSAPPSPHHPQDPPELPRTPGYVLHTASHWEDPETTPTTVSERIQHWFRSRPPAKAP